MRWRRAQIVLWSAQHLDVPAIAKIAFTSEDRVREVIQEPDSRALRPRRGKGDEQGARRSGPRRRRRATYKRPHGVRQLLAAYDLCTNRLYGHIKVKKGRTVFLTFLRNVRSLHPPGVRIAVVLDNFSPHLSTKTPG